MEGVARGKIEPRKVLWRLRVKKNSFVVTSEHLDAKGNTIPGTVKQINVLSKPYAELSPSHKALVDEAVTSAIREQYGNSSKREIAMRDYKTAKEQNKVNGANIVERHQISDGIIETITCVFVENGVKSSGAVLEGRPNGEGGRLRRAPR